MVTICYVCLSTDKTLQELDERLSDFYLEICDDTRSTNANLLCCPPCKETLQHYLDFRYKCRMSNRILQEWENNNSQEKIPIESLEILQSGTVEYLELSTFDEDIIYSEDMDVQSTVEIINDEIIKEEFEYEALKTEKEEILDAKDEIEDDTDVGDNVEMELKDEKPESNDDNNDEQVTTYRIVGELGKRSDFKQFESVFDIEVFETYDDARRELLSRRGLEPYLSASHRCDICYTVYKSDGLLQYHMRWHDPAILEYECDVCNMRVSERHMLSRHKSNLHRAKFVCKLCPLVFYKQTAMKRHFEKHMGKAFKKFEGDGASSPTSFISVACSICGLSFANLNQLADHKRSKHLMGRRRDSNSGTKRRRNEAKLYEVVECKLCGKKGYRPSWLYQHHRREHTSTPYEAPHGQRDHLCDQCGQAFYSKYQLEEHRHVHSGLKPYRCEICPKAFRTKLALKSHIERHGPPTRECPHCGKLFKCASNLCNHIRTHVGDRRFICSYCGKGFLHRAAEREHIRYVHLKLRRDRNKHTAGRQTVKEME